MAERSDISVDWGIITDRSSPRIIEVASPSTLLLIQDLIDSVRSNTLASGEPDLDNLDDDPIFTQEFDPAGKVPTEPGIASGITVLCRATEGTLVSYLRDVGSHTGANSNTVLIDSAAFFVSFGIDEKDVEPFVVINETDGSQANVVTVDSENQITTDGLTGGSDNTFEAGDIITVQGYALSPIAPSAFTSVSYSTSVAPSIQSLETIEDRIREIWKLLGLDDTDEITITPSGVTSQSGTITIDFTGDGITSTTMARQ
jgi:hypothetical protein